MSLIKSTDNTNIITCFTSNQEKADYWTLFYSFLRWKNVEKSAARDFANAVMRFINIPLSSETTVYHGTRYMVVPNANSLQLQPIVVKSEEELIRYLIHEIPKYVNNITFFPEILENCVALCKAPSLKQFRKDRGILSQEELKQKQLEQEQEKKKQELSRIVDNPEGIIHVPDLVINGKPVSGFFCKRFHDMSLNNGKKVMSGLPGTRLITVSEFNTLYALLSKYDATRILEDRMDSCFTLVENGEFIIDEKGVTRKTLGLEDKSRIPHSEEYLRYCAENQYAVWNCPTISAIFVLPDDVDAFDFCKKHIADYYKYQE